MNMSIRTGCFLFRCTICSVNLLGFPLHRGMHHHSRPVLTTHGLPIFSFLLFLYSSHCLIWARKSGRSTPPHTYPPPFRLLLFFSFILRSLSPCISIILAPTILYHSLFTSSEKPRNLNSLIARVLNLLVSPRLQMAKLEGTITFQINLSQSQADLPTPVTG
ncbi:hypothetical protein BT96DRAFT_285069 [Gymnopus androsaceus JB14]|uniref:Uncharacterized protein n=1 Tax=Gymnopus androsaceus JB14 TaxID=1447944 RepID=A0A6A4I6R3_9AGAR|nr:hypothetical protein BT96DRAFT_285069 [Gymnopus androsaceus JB14]